MAESGDIEAQFVLGMEYEFYTDNLEEAKKWYRKALEHPKEEKSFSKINDARYSAKQRLDALLEKEERDQKERELKKQAESGDSKALNKLGVLYFHEGYGGSVEEDAEKSEFGREQAGEKGERVFTYKTFHYCIKTKWDKFVDLFKKAAEKGYVPAMYNLGMCYDNGWAATDENEDSAEPDAKKARAWWKKAANLGDADAMVALSHSLILLGDVCFSHRHDPAWHKHLYEKYNKQAIKWMLKAAELGHKKAIGDLYSSYKFYQYSFMDFEKSAEWGVKAKEKGISSGFEKLTQENFEELSQTGLYAYERLIKAVLLYKGIIFEQDKTKAKEALEIFIKEYEKKPKHKDEDDNFMDEKHLNEAKRLLNKWCF